MMTARDEFLAALDQNRRSGAGVAVSVCSAHRDVLRALFRTARERNQFALVESTSNQVDQYGGYTGMKPADFVALVRAVAQEEGFPADRILLGGDHLGPNRWQSGPAEKAMSEAETLMAAYVEAGYEKIHLDASFVCADDTAPLSDEIVASRCVRLARVCERHAAGRPPVYIIGTEVPTPGGAVDEEGLHPTSPADAERTLAGVRRRLPRRRTRGRLVTGGRAGGSAWRRILRRRDRRLSRRQGAGRGRSSSSRHGVRSPFDRLPDGRPI